jgi:hypothetical protein
VGRFVRGQGWDYRMLIVESMKLSSVWSAPSVSRLLNGSPYHMAVVTGASASVVEQTYQLTPVLQAQDGSFVGTVQDSNNGRQTRHGRLRFKRYHPLDRA